MDVRWDPIERVGRDPEPSLVPRSMDVRVMEATDGRERTVEEYDAALDGDASREYVDTRYPENERTGADEATAA